MKTKITIQTNLTEKLKKYLGTQWKPSSSTRNQLSFTKNDTFNKSTHNKHKQIKKYFFLQKFINDNLLKYNSNNNTHNSNIIKWIMFDEKHRIVSIFKNFLLWDESSEFLKRFYYITESTQRIPKITSYYEQYTLFPANYYGLNYGEVKIMTKWIKRKTKYLEYIENEGEQEEDEGLISINIHKSKNESNNEYIYNNNDLLISPKELESTKHEPPLNKSKSFNEHLSDLSSMFREIKKPSNPNKSLCSLMKDISSIHSIVKNKEQTKHSNHKRNSHHNGKIDLKSTNTNKSKKTINLIQVSPLMKNNLFFTKKIKEITKLNFANLNTPKTKNVKSTASSKEKRKQIKKQFPLLTDQPVRNSVNMQKNIQIKKRLVLKQQAIVNDNHFITNIRNQPEINNDIRANSVKLEKRTKVNIGRNKCNNNIDQMKKKGNKVGNCLFAHINELKYPYLLTERSQQSRKVSGSSKDIMRSVKSKSCKKKMICQGVMKTQRLNNEREIIRKLFFRKKNGL